MLSLRYLHGKIFLVLALSIGLLILARVIPVQAETIQVEGGIAISGEFTGASVEVNPPGEETFTTPPVPTGDQSPTTSPETTFQTLPVPTGGGEPSAEGTFTTSSKENSQPPGNGGNSGGGSSGGGYGFRLPVPLATSSPRQIVGECPIYLTKFIRLGAENDPVEVRNLQKFLRDYEQMDVPADGVYGETTFEAVKIFQLRYAEAILKPWGIDYPTGYVYITTTLAINNLYCERDPATTLDLRLQRPVSNEVGDPTLIEGPTTSPTSTLPLMGQATSTNRLLVATLGMFNFFKQIPFWWWILLFLTVLYFVFDKRRKRKDQGS